MENSIKENYTVWLRQYGSHSKDKITVGLIKQISETTSIDGLIDLFSQYLEPEMAAYGTIAFNTRISTWKDELEKILVALPEAILMVDSLEISMENQDLILLIKELLSDHNLLLNIRMPGLLHRLSNKELPDLIEYIAHLPKVPAPLNPPVGSFAALKPKCEKHAACLAMLNNLAAAIDTKHSLWNSANALLQTTLLIYEDLEMVEISLSDKQVTTKMKKPPKNESCCLM